MSVQFFYRPKSKAGSSILLSVIPPNLAHVCASEEKTQLQRWYSGSQKLHLFLLSEILY